jgi:hypothetical protein
MLLQMGGGLAAGGLLPKLLAKLAGRGAVGTMLSKTPHWASSMGGFIGGDIATGALLDALQGDQGNDAELANTLPVQPRSNDNLEALMAALRAEPTEPVYQEEPPLLV